MTVELKVLEYALLETDRFTIQPKDDVHPAFHRFIVKCTYAESWLDAKERLGFDLTAQQTWLRQEQLKQVREAA